MPSGAPIAINRWPRPILPLCWTHGAAVGGLYSSSSTRRRIQPRRCTPRIPDTPFRMPSHRFPMNPYWSSRSTAPLVGTDLESRLLQTRIGHLVVTGLTTSHCVSTTTHMAANLGFDTWIVSDATATFGRRRPDGAWYSAETLHAIGLAELHDEFAPVLTTAEVLQSMEQHSLIEVRPGPVAPGLQHLRRDELPAEWLNPILSAKSCGGRAGHGFAAVSAQGSNRPLA